MWIGASVGGAYPNRGLQEYRVFSSALNDRRDAHAAGRANRDEAALAVGFVERLCERRENSSSARRKRMAKCEASAIDIELCPVDRAERRALPELVAAKRAVFPSSESAQHLAGERLVNLVEIELLQRPVGIAVQLRDRKNRGHQQALLLCDKIHCCDLAIAQERQYRQIALGGPFFGGEQNRRRPVGHRRRI